MTDVIEQSFEVRYRYPVYFTRDVFAPTNATLRDVIHGQKKAAPKVLVVVDGGVVRHYPELRSQLKRYASRHQLRVSWPVLELPAGEVVKQQRDGVDEVLEAIHLRG